MVVLESEVFVSTSGFQFPFDTKLQYRNLNGTPGWDMSGGLGGLQNTGGQVNYKEGPNSIKIFYPVGGGAYQASYFVQDRLQYDSGTSTYELRRSDGLLLKFYASGKLKSFLNLGGVVGTVTYSGGGDSGNLASVSMTDGANTWAFAYTWTSGRLTRIIFSVNSTNVRKLEFAYDGSQRLKTIKSFAYAGGTWSTIPIEATLYTYHGTTQFLRHVITPTGYRQLVNNGFTPDSMADDDFNPYAETEYVYHSMAPNTNRVQTMYTHGRTYTYGFTYTDQSQSSTSLNVWTRKAEVEMPDGSTVRYYFNRGGQIMVHQVDSNGSPNKTWSVKYQQFQENTGRLLLDADATAIVDVDENLPELVTLAESTGRIRTYTYHSSGHLNEERVQEGADAVTVHVKSARTYTFRSATGALGGVWVPASETIYSETGLGGGATTSFAYSWHGTTLQMSQRVTTRPVVSTGQNGSGTATTLTENFNTAGYLTSVVDESGITTQYTFDAVRGEMTQEVVDPGGSPHLDLTTDYTIDDLGRTTLKLGPAHDIDLNGSNTNIRRAQWTQYLDEAGEVRTFGGYRKTTGSVDQIVGPVTIVSPNSPRATFGTLGDKRADRIDAVYTTAGIPAPTTTFARSTYVRWTIELYSQGNKLKEEWNYFVIPASGYGTQSTNYGKRLFAYDSAGRLNQTTCAGGTIDKTTFNAMGWAEKEEIGTSAGLTTTESKEYFDTGKLKKRTLLVDGDTTHNRVQDYSYDYRQRLLEEQTTVEKDGTGTWTLLTRYEYDNRDMQTVVTTYHTSVATGTRTGHTTAAYDPLGRLYRQQRRAVAANGDLGNTLTDNFYFNKTGQVAREERSGSALAVATKYDAAGRPTERFWATGTFSTSDPASVTNATVVEQEATVWDKGSNPISTVRKQRFDTATGTGELKNKDDQPKARIYYKEFYFDALGREIAGADYGTNGGSTVGRDDEVPPRSDTVLVTTTAYSSAGNVATITDPAGVATSQTWDAEDRLITVTENAWTASSSSSSSSSGFATDVRTTRFEYTDDGWLKKLKSENAATGQQVTEWVYGVTPTGSGSSEQGLYSNRLVREKIYPTTGAGSSTVQYAYNRQKQVRTFTDQISTAHAYSYDKLGRLIMDAVTAFGSGINDTIEKLVWGYDNRGRLARAASLAKTSGNILNEVKRDFNGFNQTTYEHQEHGQAVNGSTLKIGYGWADGTSNTIRQTGVTYPNAGTLSIDYGSGLDSSLSRPLALKESSTTIASMRYLGLGVQVGLKYDAASSVHFTYEAGGTGDAGDNYTGLDRFGRLVETIWIRSDKYQVRTQYGRNRVGGVVWKKDVKASTGQDHYYWYDRLQQVRQHQRGTLTPGSPPYTGITSLQQTEVITFDETGNWLSYSATSPSSVTQYRTHNKANWITALTGSPDGVDPVYANTGNMTTMPKVGAWTTAQTLVWDAWNRLIEVNEGGSDVSTNTYDAFHRRIRKATTSETRDYYYDFNWRSVEERVGTPGSQTVKAQYTWSPTDRWTMIRRKRSTTGTLNEVLYVLKDHLDPAALLAPGSPNATVVERFGFDAFGPVRFMDGSFGSIGSSAYDWNFLFHAEFMDQESGLYNYGYRYYHASLGRWLSRDPLGEATGRNLYSGLHNNALDSVDVLGLAKCKVCAVFCSGRKDSIGGRSYITMEVEYDPKQQCCCPTMDPECFEVYSKLPLWTHLGYSSSNDCVTAIRAYNNETTPGRAGDNAASFGAGALLGSVLAGNAGAAIGAATDVSGNAISGNGNTAQNAGTAYARKICDTSLCACEVDQWLLGNTVWNGIFGRLMQPPAGRTR